MFHTNSCSWEVMK
uniref:Uncharacterized protein n=1 Tax=Rhizophora mucronata TaxID=61149 RepID=A0A2P2R2P4_RHIMU